MQRALSPLGETPWLVWTNVILGHAPLQQPPAHCVFYSHPCSPLYRPILLRKLPSQCLDALHDSLEGIFVLVGGLAGDSSLP